MIVTCPSCSARFRYDEARFQGASFKHFKCPKCAAKFEVRNPTLESTVAEITVPSDMNEGGPPASFGSFDRTHERAPLTLPHVVPVPSPDPAPDLPPTPSARAEDADSVRDTTARGDRQTMMTTLANDGAIPSGWRISLAFLTGPKASTVKVLDKAQTVIGREEGDIITGDPETSRRHLSIEIHNDSSVWIKDLGSTNGTFVDGVQVDGTVQLLDRQEFTCGKSTFMILIRKEDHHNLG